MIIEHKAFKLANKTSNMDLPLAPVKKMLLRSGLRASASATKEFAQLLEEVIADIAAESAKIAKSNNRKTVLASDVRAARNKIM